MFFLPLVSSAPALYALCGLYGFGFFSNYGMQSPILFKLVGIERLAGAFGVLQFFQGIAACIGIPLTGYIMDTTGSFYIPFLLCASFFALAATILTLGTITSLEWNHSVLSCLPKEISDKSKESRRSLEKQISRVGSSKSLRCQSLSPPRILRSPSPTGCASPEGRKLSQIDESAVV